MKSKTLGELAEPNQQIPEPLLRQKFPELFVVETEFRVAMTKAELAFVSDLVRRITQDGWGPVGCGARCRRIASGGISARRKRRRTRARTSRLLGHEGVASFGRVGAMVIE